MSADAAPSSITRHAPIALWRVAEAFLHTLHMLFGAPEDVAREHTLTAKAHKQMAQWLRCAEALLRRLLAIEASAHAPPASSLQTAPAGKMPALRVRKLMSFAADAPQTWRVSFRCFYGPPASRRHAPVLAGGTPAVHTRFRSAWPLAERYEALLRVFNDPTAYARRLSRRLHATPHRLREVLRAPPEAAHRVDDFATLTFEAEHAWRPHFSSG